MFLTSVPRKKKRNVSVMTAISLTRLVVLRAALCVMFLNVYLCCDSPKAIKPEEVKYYEQREDAVVDDTYIEYRRS